MGWDVLGRGVKEAQKLHNLFHPPPVRKEWMMKGVRRGKGHPDEGEKGLVPVSRVQRMVARQREKMIRNARGSVTPLWLVYIPRPLRPSLLPSLPLSYTRPSCHRCFWKTWCGIETFTGVFGFFFFGTKHLAADFLTCLKDTSTPRCWCRPCGWGSSAWDTAAPAAASWRWSWSVSWALSCSAVSSFAWNWPWRWARPLPTRAPHLHSMRRFPSSLPAARRRWPPASSALPPGWVCALGPSPPCPARDWRRLLLPFHRGRRGWRRGCAHWWDLGEEAEEAGEGESSPSLGKEERKRNKVKIKQHRLDVRKFLNDIR